MKLPPDSQNQQPEQKTVLGFPVRPGGDGGAVAAGRHPWYDLADKVHGAFADIERVVASMRWSGDARTAFDVAWSELSGHGADASQHAHDMGDHLQKLGHQIEDAQHHWDLAMAAMVTFTAIGIGLTFVTFGISDAVAEGAAAASVIPGLGSRATIGGRQVLQGTSGAMISGALTDVTIQGMEAITEGKPFNPGEVVLSGVLVGAGQGVAKAIGARRVATDVDPVEQAWRARLTPEQAARQAVWDLAAAESAKPQNFSSVSEPLTGHVAKAIHDQSHGSVVAVGRRIVNPDVPGIRELTDLDIETETPSSR